MTDQSPIDDVVKCARAVVDAGCDAFPMYRQALKDALTALDQTLAERRNGCRWKGPFRADHFQVWDQTNRIIYVGNKMNDDTLQTIAAALNAWFGWEVKE